MVVGRKPPREHMHVRGCQVEALCTSWRDGMRRVTSQEKAPVPHGLANEGSQGNDPLLENFTLFQAKLLSGYSRLEFFPDPLLRPMVNGVVRITLEIHSLDLWCLGADQSKPALMMGVDEFIRRRTRLGEDAEPAKGIDPEVVLTDAAFRHGLAADPIAA